MRPKVTFFMPSIRDRFLQEAAESVHNQSLKEFEVLFFDNHPDGRNIVFDDDRFKVFHTGGWNIPKSFNEAMKIANSDIIIQAHDDDICFQEKAELLYNKISNGADIAHGGYIGIVENGEQRGVFFGRPFDVELHKKKYSQIAFPMSACRISRVPTMWEDLPIIHDYAFFLECYMKGLKFQHIQMPLGQLRIWTTLRTLYPKKVVAEGQIVRQRFGDPSLRAEHFSMQEPEERNRRREEIIREGSDAHAVG